MTIPLKHDAAFTTNFSSPSTPIGRVADVFERDTLINVDDAKMAEFEVGQFYRMDRYSGRDRLSAFEAALRRAAELQWQTRYSTRGTRFYAVRVGTTMLVMRHVPQS